MARDRSRLYRMDCWTSSSILFRLMDSMVIDTKCRPSISLACPTRRGCRLCEGWLTSHWVATVAELIYKVKFINLLPSLCSSNLWIRRIQDDKNIIWNLISNDIFIILNRKFSNWKSNFVFWISFCAVGRGGAPRARAWVHSQTDAERWGQNRLQALFSWTLRN